MSYNNTSGVFTFTPPDLSSYLVGSSLSVATNSASGSGSLGYNTSTSTFTFTPPDLSQYLSSSSSINSLADVDTASVSPQNGDTIVWDSTANKWKPGAVSSTSGTTTLASQEKSLTTSLIPAGETIEFEITNMPTTYVILSVTTDFDNPSSPDGTVWATLYGTSLDRFDDGMREITRDPIPGSGVFVETVAKGTQKIVPGVVVSSDISKRCYVKLVNLNEVGVSVLFKIKYIALEV